MSKQKPTLPKGTRDFGPAEMNKRYFILDTIKKVYQKYGYAPIETPAMEEISTLEGKYGDEGDQLLFKILESGDFEARANSKFLNNHPEIKNQIFSSVRESIWDLISLINEKGYKEGNQELLDRFLTKYDSSVDNLDDSVEKASIYSQFRFFLKEKLDLIVEDYLRYKKNNPTVSDKSFDKYMISVQNMLIQSVNIVKEFESRKSYVQHIAEKGLRYDLTVPFARFVVMNQDKLAFPFKRYQIQPVWRADRPQKGRYREFYQCDADAIGTNSLLCEAEIVLMIQEVFEKLQNQKPNTLDYAIKINNRKVLTGIVEVMEAMGKETDFAVAIDKLDKIGEEKVKEELSERGFSNESLDKITPLFALKGSNEEQISILKDFLQNSEIGLKGIAELEEVFSILQHLGADVPQLELDVTLARGLSYYTGAIFEVKPKNVVMGSISGGGRYDGLTDHFGLPDVSGVGISFGVDRIYDVLEELELFPDVNQQGTQVLIVAFDNETWTYGLKVLNALRKNDIKSELYPEPLKLKKQMKYGNDKNIPFVIVIGSEEMKSGELSLKDMQAGTQNNMQLNDIINKLSYN